MHMTRASLVERHPQGTAGNRPTDALDTHHRLIWSLFPGAGERDFLFREITPGCFLVLSDRRPAAAPGFRLVREEWVTDADCGERLRFDLRVNATRCVRNGRGRGRRVDIVMEELSRAQPAQDSDADRLPVARSAASRWLAAQGGKHGFEVADGDVTVERYRVMRAGRRTGGPAVFGVIDVRGVLTVTESRRLGAVVRNGLGRARAFGCGLLLLNRVGRDRGLGLLTGRTAGIPGR